MKTFKTILMTIAVVMIFTTVSIKAQEIDKAVPALTRNTFFVEAGGNSIATSLNYSRTLCQENKTKFAGRIGVGSSVITHLNIPIEITVLHGVDHHFEFGPGYRLGIEFNSYDHDDDENTANKEVITASSFTLRTGYRYQPSAESGKRLYASAGLVLNVTPNKGNGLDWFNDGKAIVFPIPSVAVGYSF